MTVDLEAWLAEYSKPEMLLVSPMCGKKKLYKAAVRLFGEEDTAGICRLAVVRASREKPEGSFATLACAYMATALVHEINRCVALKRGGGGRRGMWVVGGTGVGGDDYTRDPADYRNQDLDSELDARDLLQLAEPADRLLLSRRYGIGRRPETVVEMAASEGVSFQAVSLREKKAVSRLAEKVKAAVEQRRWYAQYGRSA